MSILPALLFSVSINFNCYQQMISQPKTPRGSNSIKQKRVIKKIYDPSQIRQIVSGTFLLYDIDSSDYLEKSQFCRALRRIVIDMGGYEPSMEDIEDILYQLDQNGDGQISKQQFLTLMEKVIKLFGDQIKRKSKKSVT